MRKPATKSQNLLLICAFRKESSLILTHYSNIEKKMIKKFTLFPIKENQLSLLEIGAGHTIEQHELKAAISLLNPSFVVNFGICGGLSSQVRLHRNYLATSVHHHNRPEINLSQYLTFLNLKYYPDFQTARLLTVKEPILNMKHRDKIHKSTGCELVDMEAYLIAQVTQELGIPLLILKQVTDYAESNAERFIKETTEIWQDSLKKGLFEILKVYK